MSDQLEDDDVLGLCNIYAQQTHHFEAFILGNKKGLIELRNAIDRALETGSSVAHLFQSDYEGDETYIALVDDEQRFEKLITPYVEEYIQEDDAVDPIDIIKGYDAEKGNLSS
ncbi:hypothetical protein HF326_13975 [Bacillus altitudinis MN12]|uniref:hypothetical protein n=1 Tax=Bacillus TaxID=1386 RepID=UPI00119E227B|nr:MULTISPECIES: hypothetical protein [Bacillus]MBR0584155.1 hypothetical protein [Bacillus altitudinis MN12]MBR0595048.1 hypothetical protein [Bacillus altitudinis C16B11]MBR0609942.1 hypothetical protein [Bacillus altitudinis]UTV33201.1 hypothetical protein NM966_01670 [Bacillus altitudinis]